MDKLKCFDIPVLSLLAEESASEHQ